MSLLIFMTGAYFQKLSRFLVRTTNINLTVPLAVEGKSNSNQYVLPDTPSSFQNSPLCTDVQQSHRDESI